MESHCKTDQASKIISLEWIYTPEIFFEEDISVDIKNNKLSIGQGKAKCLIDTNQYKENPGIIEDIHKTLYLRFQSALIYKYAEFLLSAPAVNFNADQPGYLGPIFITAHGLAHSSRSKPLDLIVINDEGVIQRDTAQERRIHQKKYADLIEKYRSDAVATAILMFFNDAVNDPKRELFHLYNIIDALGKRFKNEKGVTDNLGITENSLDFFHKYAHEKYFEARHPGLHVGKLQHAPIAILEKERLIARELFEAYLDFLEREQNSTLL
jgi:hypothetical protein